MSSRDSVFGSSSQTFVHLSKDSRVHLWDVASKKERKSYVDKNHLTHSFTSYAWRTTKDQTGGIFVAGYSDGLVGIWDLNRGVQSQIIGKANESEVPTDIVFSNDSKSIFVSSNDNQIVQYDVATGKEINSIKTGKKGNLKLAMNPKLDVIAAASSSIKIIDVATGRKRKLEASFSGGISALTFTPCGRFLAAASTRTRELLVFDTRAEAETDTPVFVLPVRGVVTGIDTKVSKNGEVVHLLAVFEDAGAAIFELDANYSKAQSNGVNLVKLELNIYSAQPILAAAFGSIGNRDESGVVLAIGAKSSPVFKHIDLNSAAPAVSGSTNSVVQKVLQLSEKGLVSESTAQVNGAKAAAEGALFAPEVLGPHEMGGVKRPIVSTSESDAAEETDGKKKRKTSDAGFIEASTNANELSLEQRLESLSSSLTRLQDSAEGTVVPASGKATLTAPTSDSLVTLIDQALQSGDDALLEQCLSCGDVAIVEATARRLPTGRIVLFLRKLVAKFEKRPSRGILLTQWLACLLRHHTAYLVTVPDLSYQLAGLSQMLEQRLSSYSKLSSLAGRLDLLMSQVNYRDAARSMQEIVPMQVYVEE